MLTRNATPHLKTDPTVLYKVFNLPAGAVSTFFNDLGIHQWAVIRLIGTQAICKKVPFIVQYKIAYLDEPRESSLNALGSEVGKCLHWLAVKVSFFFSRYKL